MLYVFYGTRSCLMAVIAEGTTGEGFVHVWDDSLWVVAVPGNRQRLQQYSAGLRFSLISHSLHTLDTEQAADG